LKVELSPFSLVLSLYLEKFSQVVALQAVILEGSSFIGRPTLSVIVMLMMRRLLESQSIELE